MQLQLWLHFKGSMLNVMLEPKSSIVKQTTLVQLMSKFGAVGFHFTNVVYKIVWALIAGRPLRIQFLFVY